MSILRTFPNSNGETHRVENKTLSFFKINNENVQNFVIIVPKHLLPANFVRINT